MTEPKTEYLLWLDLETTGLDPQQCGIIELAWFVTPLLGAHDCDVDSFEMNRLVICTDKPWTGFAQRTHASSGLATASMLSSHSLTDADQLLKKTLMGLPTTSIVYLAGSSVHFDMGFLREHLPDVSRRLHYRLFDVSAQRLFFESLGYRFEDRKEKPHRAVEDIKASFELYRRFKGLAPSKDEETALLEGLLSL